MSRKRSINGEVDHLRQQWTNSPERNYPFSDSSRERAIRRIVQDTVEPVKAEPVKDSAKDIENNVIQESKRTGKSVVLNKYHPDNRRVADDPNDDTLKRLNEGIKNISEELRKYRGE